MLSEYERNKLLKERVKLVKEARKLLANSEGTKINKRALEINLGNHVHSNSEIRISEYLTSINLIHYSEHEFKDCINPITSKRLRFDFYVPVFNLVIEYDGILHYKNENKAELDSQKYRDKLKNDYCELNNINILRIPYYNNYIEIEIDRTISRLKDILTLGRPKTIEDYKISDSWNKLR